MRMKNSPPSGLVVYWSERTMLAPGLEEESRHGADDPGPIAHRR